MSSKHHHHSAQSTLQKEKVDINFQGNQVAAGRILNLHPPKFVTARKVLKDTILASGNIRVGLAVFGVDASTYYDPPTVLQPMQPDCDKSFPTMDMAQLNTARANAVSKINQIVFTKNERNVGEVLFGLGAYFSSQRVDNRWRVGAGGEKAAVALFGLRPRKQQSAA